MHESHFDLEYGDQFGHYLRRHGKWSQYRTGRFRCTPVSHTGKHCMYRHYLKYPKTIQMLRWNKAWEDAGIKGRSKLNHLPTAWDDRYKPRSKSWKEYRRTQYKHAGLV